MKTYLITPHAPLLLRKGKSTRGERADDSFSFPLPSTVAGMLRTAWANAKPDERTFEQAKKKSCGGHLLARLRQAQPPQPLFPKPADAYYAALEDDQGNVRLENGKPVKKLYRLAPADLAQRIADAGCDLPNGLQPVFLPNGTPPSKPTDGAAWWTLDNLAHWLLAQDEKCAAVDQLGANHLPTETRTHVKIDPQRRSSESGHLFRSTGVDFMNVRNTPEEHQGDLSKRGWHSERYALLARFKEKIDDGLVRLGSGGRLSHLQEQEQEQDTAWPTIPDKLSKKLKRLKKGDGFRLLLVTPALFENNGWLPDWLDKDSLEGELCGAKVQLKAAALERWQPLAGWDMADNNGKGKYKPSQRLVPAGSVYWFEITDGNTLNAEELWLTAIGNKTQDGFETQDGFGLVVPGIWQPNNNT